MSIVYSRITLCYHNLRHLLVSMEDTTILGSLASFPDASAIEGGIIAIQCGESTSRTERAVGPQARLSTPLASH